MKLVISGYGRMGKEIEKAALQKGYEIAAVVDKADDLELYASRISSADVAIDFSLPETAAGNLIFFLEKNVPVVVGTTGWYDRFGEVKECCCRNNGSMLYGSNMSVGVNLFFVLNRALATLMRQYPEYRPGVEETHHIHKKDAPSGTAISLANDIVNQYEHLSEWKMNAEYAEDTLPVFAFREGEVVGKHLVKYSSLMDEISIRHEAFSREGFALGAIRAAEWLPGHQGVFTMQDMLKAQLIL